ncbi:hypothetical protein F2P56_001034 [Juglans regia]|uniref:Pectinesterase inhibitor domain-containing protein n=2 Tax=Juglans regia TaxID=51240 RepID=A0A833Y9Q6_JUGRE|nr:pectinesterase inhibitor 4-like [Juglans regia]KAF5480271.1 hypothetical protein F2P56_001034 [Juglans regia]
MEVYMSSTSPGSYSRLRFLLYLLTLLLSIINSHLSLASAATSTSSTQTYKTYIKTTCNSTLYPKVCYKSLSYHASEIKTDPLKLCNAALEVALEAAQNTSSTVSKISKQTGLLSTETAVIEDCIDNVKDSIYELRDSQNAMGQLGGSNAEFQIDNVKTWVSAAITDENTCLDGLDEMKVNTTVKKKIRKSILNLCKMTSNALALINTLKY